MRLTADIDSRFDTAFPSACARIGCKPLDLLGVMYSESGCKPAAHNRGPLGDPPEKRYNAVGLIQFMPATLLGLGWTRGYEAFKHLSASEQLPFVIAYFTPWQKTGAPWDSAGRLYQACFLPGTLAKLRAPDDVLSARGGFLGWAYEANKTFDANGDGRITIGELTEAIQRNAHGPRWTELLARLGLKAPSSGVTLDAAIANGPDALDLYLRTVVGLQTALVRLGAELVPDGFPGPKTRAAVAAFQQTAGLDVDGIAGAHTRAALVAALIPVALADRVTTPALDDETLEGTGPLDEIEAAPDDAPPPRRRRKKDGAKDVGE